MRRSRRFGLWAAALGLVLAAPALRAGAPEKAEGKPPTAVPLSPAAVADAVRQLGSRDPAVRRGATELLLRAGPAALGALQAAETSDADVVNQLARLVEAIRYGLDDKTPKAVVELVNKYRSGDPEALPDIVEKLAAEGEAGQRAVRAIALAHRPQEGGENEPPAGNPFAGFGGRLYERLPELAKAERFDEIEALLWVADAGDQDDALRHLDSRDDPARDLVAFHLVRGTLDRLTQESQERLDGCAGFGDTPLARRTARLLAYAYRGKGQTEKARVTAARWGLDELADKLAAELGRWQDLKEFRLNLDEHADDIGVLGRIAAYRRIVGDRAGFEAALKKIQAYAARKPDDAWDAAKALLLNRRAEDALELLVRCHEYRAAIELLESQCRYEKAFEVAEKAMGRDAIWAQAWLAGFLAKRGLRDKARAAFDDLAARAYGFGIWDAPETIISMEYKSGLEKEAIGHLAAAAARPKDGHKPILDTVESLLPTHGKGAAAWWTFMRAEFADEPPRTTMARLWDLHRKKLTEAELDALLRKAEQAAAKLQRRKADEPDPRAQLLDALGETCALYGRIDRAVEFLLAAESAQGTKSVEERFFPIPADRDALRIGKLRAAQGKWDEAARAFGRAWERDKDLTAALYLQGWALGKLGREAEGRAKRDAARLLPLARGELRSDLADALKEHGLEEESAAEDRLLLCTEEPDSIYIGITLCREANRARAAKELDRADFLTERSLMYTYDAKGCFAETPGYLHGPACVHYYRAQTRLAEGKIEQAMAEALIGLDLLPGDPDVPNALVPGLEKAGRVKEADELFNRVYGVLEKACQVCPSSATTHSSLASMGARCHRRLDAALEHGRRAVELEPGGAKFLATLAEVHFQRGELEKAVEVGERALKLDNGKVYRDQLERFRAAQDGKKAP